MKKIKYSKKFVKSYSKLPLKIRNKVDKQLRYLVEDFHYPSLRTKKMDAVGRWEARVDRFYRFTFDLIDETIFLLTLGTHDEGLGKK